MADQTEARADERQNGELVSVKLAAIKAYKGAILTFNSSGYADQADADEPLAGVAFETVDNSAGAAGDKEIRVWREGVFEFATSGANQASVGKNAFVTDDQTVHTTSAAGRVPIGVIVEYISATKVRVQINRNASVIVVDTTA